MQCVHKFHFRLLRCGDQAFRKFLGSNTFLVLGLEIPDFDDKPSEVADRLRPLLELLDVLVLQTHLTRRWDFCRTAYPSVLRDSEDGCSQSVPMLSAVRWMELLRTRRPICLSVNMAALRFRLAGRPGSNSACTGFAETNQPCGEAQGWHVGHVQQWAHCGVRHTADLWESYEVPDLLEQKVKMVMAAHSATCWAVFNADLDASSETCNQESFARLKNTWKAGGYSEEAGFIDEKGPETGPVVCVFDRVPDSMVLPPGLCGTVVYAGVAYSAQHHSLLAEDEGDLDAFVTLRKAEAPVLLVAGVRSSSLPERWTSSAQRTRAWAAQAAAWLRLKRLDGMALLLGRWPRRVSLLRVFLQEVLDVFGTSQSPGKLRLILGVPPHQKITDLLTVVTEAVDTLIFTGHHESPAAACRVAEPSSPASGDDPLAVLVETTASMKTLRAEVRTQLRMCFSVNLAVLSFARDRSTLTVGDSCVEETASDYAETCPVKDGTRVEGALSCLALNSTHLQTFEDERTIATKVGFLRQQFPDACVAAFHVEREDSRRACPERVPFSRLAAIRTSLAAAAVPSPSGPIVADSGKQLVAAGFLLCVLSEFGMGLASFPAELCSHVIFTGLGYDVNESSVRVKNESVFKEFLALGERTRIVAAVDNSAVAEPSDVLRQAFAETVCNWLAKHAMAGLAVLRGAHADLEQTWELLQALRLELSRTPKERLQLIFGTASRGASPTLLKIADEVDFFVLIHHSELDEECRSAFAPLNRFSRRDLMEAAHVLRKTAVKKPLATCLSMSLAVLNVATLADTDAAACQNRTLSTYDQLCSPGEALTVVDRDSAGGVHRRVGNTTQFYENEESVLEKLFAVQSMFPLKCMATFHSDYEDFGGSCVRNSPFSRLQEIAKVIGALVCMVSPHFTAMKTFPVDNCDYLVYMDGTSDIRDEWSQPGTQVGAPMTPTRVTPFGAEGAASERAQSDPHA
ncbi:hypothetical protein ISCGN_012957 [Ixodes scapularis]